MTPKNDLVEKRKNQILDAATIVFTERGFSEARMDDIVAESGLSKGSLYWYFESKEAIIMAIMDRIFAREETQFLEMFADTTVSSAEMLTTLIAMLSQEIKEMEALMPIFVEFWSLSLRKEKINAAITRYYQRFLTIVEHILLRGIEAGEFRAVDVKQTAFLFGATYEGSILMWFYFPENINLPDQFQTNLTLLLHGLLIPK